MVMVAVIYLEECGICVCAYLLSWEKEWWLYVILLSLFKWP